MAAIRWGRGFFRVWILLAFAWVSIGIAVGLGSLINPYVPGQVMAIPADTGAVTMFPSWGTEHTELRKLVTSGAMKEHNMGDGILLFLRTETPADRLASRITEAEGLAADYLVSETAVRRSQALLPVVAWVLLPPVIVLLIGWAVGWAILGFRRMP